MKKVITKKTITIILAIIIAFALVACGNSSNNGNGSYPVDLSGIERQLEELREQNRQQAEELNNLRNQNNNQADRIDELEREVDRANGNFDWDNPIIITDLVAFMDLQRNDFDEFIRLYYRRVIQVTFIIGNIGGNVVDSAVGIQVSFRPGMQTILQDLANQGQEVTFRGVVRDYSYGNFGITLRHGRIVRN